MGLSASKSAPPGSAIVITGCDTGFGNMCALQLSKEGFKIYAGCLTEKGAAALTKKAQENGVMGGNLIAFTLDITKDADAKKTYEMIAKEEGGLYCLINNAGIGAGGFLESVAMETYERCLQINTLGAVRMTKWLLPSLRKYSKKNPELPPSRIVMITSVAGRLAAPMMSPYCASKFALEAITDCLRRELIMNNHRVSVALIEPFFAKTAIVDPFFNDSIESRLKMLTSGILPELKDQVLADWGGIEKITFALESQPTPPMMDPQTVVDEILDQVKAPVTTERTCVGRFPSKALLFAFEHFSDSWIDWALFQTAGKISEYQWQKELRSRK